MSVTVAVTKREGSVMGTVVARIADPGGLVKDVNFNVVVQASPPIVWGPRAPSIVRRPGVFEFDFVLDADFTSEVSVHAILEDGTLVPGDVVVTLPKRNGAGVGSTLEVQAANGDSLVATKLHFVEQVVTVNPTTKVATVALDGRYHTKGESDAKYATLSHTHAYLPVSGGVVSGPLNLSRGNVILGEDANGGIEIGNSLGAGTPFIDFHKGVGAAQDYNVRFINAAANYLLVQFAAGTGTFNVAGGITQSGTPVSLAGHNHDGQYASVAHGHSFASLSGLPSTLAGYGITDGVAQGSAPAFTSVSLSGHTLYAPNALNLLTHGGQTQGIRVGSVLVSDTYADGFPMGFSTAIHAKGYLSTFGPSGGVLYGARDGGPAFIAYATGGLFRIYSNGAVADRMTMDHSGHTSFVGNVHSAHGLSVRNLRIFQGPTYTATIGTIDNSNMYLQAGSAGAVVIGDAMVAGYKLSVDGAVKANAMYLSATAGVFMYSNHNSHWQVQNSSGGYDNFLWPRWTDGNTYLNFGGGGHFFIRDNENNNKFVVSRAGTQTDGVAYFSSSTYNAAVYSTKIGGQRDDSTTTSTITTTPNLHLDCSNGNTTYINYFSQRPVVIGRTAPLGFALEVSGSTRTSAYYYAGSTLSRLSSDDSYWYTQSAHGVRFSNHGGTYQGGIHHDGSGFGLLHSGGGWFLRARPGRQDVFGMVAVTNDASRDASSGGGWITFDADNHPHTTSGAFRGIAWGNAQFTQYGIYKGPATSIHGYAQLRIAYHTGIQIGAQTQYGGVRFYSTETMTDPILSVGAGDNHVRVWQDLHVEGTPYDRYGHPLVSAAFGPDYPQPGTAARVGTLFFVG